MKLFTFYEDDADLEHSGHSDILFSIVRTDGGYGMFYYSYKNGKLIGVDSRGTNVKAYYENNSDHVRKLDAGLNVNGKGKLKEIQQSQFQRKFLEEVFTNPDLINTWKMWSK